MANTHTGGSQQSGGSERNKSGNFSSDSDRAGEAGRKGGQQSHSGTHGTKDDAERSQRSGSGNFADDPGKASEAGRKGGQHSGSSK